VNGIKSVAIFGGTFNPIHYGHLIIAEEIRSKYNLDKVIFVPSHLPPHKEPTDLIDARKRFIMVHLATVGNPCFDVSDYEINKGGRSYSVDTVRHFSQIYGEETQLYFIIGADQLIEISSWKNIETLLTLCRFIAVPRPGIDTDKIFNYKMIGSSSRPLDTEIMNNVVIEQVTTSDISSTAIRQKVREWKSIKYMVPEPVEQYIHNQKLYL
jgi:nicotinate-nucleotide adenylyltransferase